MGEGERLTLMIFRGADPATSTAVVHTDDREFCTSVIRQYVRRLHDSVVGEDELDRLLGGGDDGDAERE